jgi:hypothetical protein
MLGFVAAIAVSGLTEFSWRLGLLVGDSCGRVQCVGHTGLPVVTLAKYLGLIYIYNYTIKCI